MKKISTNYGEFHARFQEDRSVEYFVKTHKGEFTRILDTVEKSADMLEVTFSNGYMICCATTHIFMGIHGDELLAIDLNIHSRVLTIHGTLVVTSIKRSDVGVAYDIGIEYPHWYVNEESNGIIHHNTGYALAIASAYLKKYSDAILLFVDSEFGSPQSYFERSGIDPSRVLHVPVTNLEEMQFELVQQLDGISRGDKVFVVIDSLGNIASKKELTDSLEGKSSTDMTRAKIMKSIFRQITPSMRLKNIPMVYIAHVYKEIGPMYPKTIMSGGQGLMLGSDCVWVVTRSQEKDGDEIVGYNFKINIEKSRYVKEKSQIPITVTYEGGINALSGIFDVALEGGFITMPKKGFYQITDLETGEIDEKNYRKKSSAVDEYLTKLITNDSFKEYIVNKYTLPVGNNTETTFDEDIESV